MNALSKTLFCWSIALLFIVIAACQGIHEARLDGLFRYFAGIAGGMSLGKWIWSSQQPDKEAKAE